MLSGGELVAAGRVIDAWWSNEIILVIATAGSIAWVIAMLAATVAFAAPERRRLTTILVLVFFLVNGWARGNLFQAPDGVSIRPAWWLVTLATSAVMILVSRPRITAGALTLSASLFGATHVTATGPWAQPAFWSPRFTSNWHRGREPKQPPLQRRPDQGVPFAA
jgi:hypothetical protein